jgi:UPF0755 protein
MKKLAALGLGLAAISAGIAYWSLKQPYRGFSQELILDIPMGTSTRRMADLLASGGVIRYQWQFLAARSIRPRARLQAGEYRFTEASSVLDVFDRIVRGDVFFHELRVPEGSNMFEIARSVEELGLMKREEFLEAASDPTPIRDLAPGAESLEGYLFPSTYRLTRHTSPGQLTKMMVEQFRHIWSQFRTDADAHKMVTLASLVEKETAVAGERATVASVFWNRLGQGMKLDCDPTTIYAALLESRYKGAIYRSDLDNRHRYNTYQHAGLPPGPIANPGVASLKAALRPAATDFLYFVAIPNGAGQHRFSKSLKEHDRAVAEYRRGTRKNNKTRDTGKLPRRSKARRG